MPWQCPYCETENFSTIDNYCEVCEKPRSHTEAKAEARPDNRSGPMQSPKGPHFRVGKRFRDDPDCPEMIVVPAGAFLMGSPEDEEGRYDSDSEGPQHRVTIAQPFAVGVYPVTFAEWEICVAGGGSRHRPDDKGWGQDQRPVINVSWEDARSYAQWLSEHTGQPYRLLSEAEWEYVARARTTTPFHTGATIDTSQANYNGTYTYRGSARRGSIAGRPYP